ncbi:MAG: DeoR/GlpR family DNA-binding transcription regulator [Lentisphaeria bacterium]|nr:DeoR/GlpR family DNA-binding transcription regulator [Lentisphaeria bacterium]
MNARQTSILSLLEKKNYCTYPELAKDFDVTEMTIRRDARALAQAGKLQLKTGGILVNQVSATDIRIHKNQSIKEALAKQVLNHIEPGSTIFLDAGSTIFYCLLEIINVNNITFITYDSHLSEAFSSDSNCQFYLTGGLFCSETGHYTGSFSERFLDSFECDYALLSANSISENGNLGCMHDHEIRLKQLMIQRSRKSILIAEDSKLSGKSRFTFEQLSSLDLLITEKRPSKSFSNNFIDSKLKWEALEEKE